MRPLRIVAREQPPIEDERARVQLSAWVYVGVVTLAWILIVGAWWIYRTVNP